MAKRTPKVPKFVSSISDIDKPTDVMTKILLDTIKHTTDLAVLKAMARNKRSTDEIRARAKERLKKLPRQNIV